MDRRRQRLLEWRSADQLSAPEDDHLTESPPHSSPKVEPSLPEYWSSLPGNVVQNTLRILDHEDAVHQHDPDHYDVVSLRTPGRRVRVHRRGDLWRCRVDRVNNQDRPCGHILAVLVYRGDVDLPNTAAQVWRKGDDGRDHGLEARAWQLVPQRAPELLAQLLGSALPVLAPASQKPATPLGGRPPKPLYPLVYQAVIRVLFRQNLHATRGLVNTSHHRQQNPYGAVGAATLSRFLSNPEHTELFEKLLALTTGPVRPYETLVHPDGTGLTEQHFSAYFDERYRRRKKEKTPPEVDPAFMGPPKPALEKAEEARKHKWTYAEILWTYRYTLIAALHTQQGPFGEAPWLIPLLQRAALTLDIAELGGDKAYDANYIFQYAREHGIDPQIKIRRTPRGGRLSHRTRFRKRVAERARLDPFGYAARANRRNNAETGNHAFKAILGDQIYSLNATAQRNEILCMAIAYNLTRLVYLELHRGTKVDFAAGADGLAKAHWVSLVDLRSLSPSRSKVRPEWT